MHCLLIFMYSHVELDGSTIGIAYTRSVCSSSFSVGVTQDTGRAETSVGATATHELGHILNMDHDDLGQLMQYHCGFGNQP